MATTQQTQQPEQTQQAQQSPKQLERKAAAKEGMVNATSGAREIVDHAAFNARAVGKILLHPFSKDAKQDAIATAREDKAVSGQRMAAIRVAGAQQADALRSSVNAPEGSQPGTLGDVDAKAASEGTTAAPAVEDRENL
jgi:hypothetical protein